MSLYKRKIKSCPSCRKSIGTKRMLRIDNNIISISIKNILISLFINGKVLKIFDDINHYMNRESEIEQQEIFIKYGMDMKDSNITVGLKRGRSKLERNL